MHGCQKVGKTNLPCQSLKAWRLELPKVGYQPNLLLFFYLCFLDVQVIANPVGDAMRVGGEHLQAEIVESG